MKLNGLNNMAFQGLQKQSAKPSSDKGAKSSFEDVLGQTKSAEVREPRGQEREQKPAPQEIKQDARDPKANNNSFAPRQDSQNTEGQKQISNPDKPQTQSAAQPSAAEGDALPMQPNAPSLKGPINDRLVTGKPVGEPSLIDPVAKDQATLPQEDAIDSLTRRAVWSDFLRKMKDDLGISAEDVLAAFASLTDEELAQPPQQTVNTVVAALGLDSDQAQKAKSYFNDLVTKTKSNSMGEELGKSQKQINLTLMSQREAQRKTLNRSIDQLQSNFFMNNAQGPMTQAQLQQMSEDGRAKATGLPGMEMIEVGAPAPLAVEGMKLSATTANFQALAPTHGSVIPVAMNPANTTPPKAQAKNTIDEMVRQFLAPQAPAEASAAPVATAQAAAAGAISAGSLKGLLADLSSSLDSEEESEYTSDASYLASGHAGEQKFAGVNGPSAEFQAELAKAAQEPMSIPDLVDKAQVMVLEGGGEMKVTLTNEGMGEVAMKVSVQDGKVQVQMITESDEAKKMIERQLSDLKTSLQSNDLSLDTIKIDTATNLGKQFEQQYEQAQRQSTASAWEQFRQDNQGWRRSFFETPSAKLYKGQGEAPRDVQAPTGNAQRKNINRRLDLVA